MCVPVWTSESPSAFANNGLIGIWGSGPTNVYALSSKSIFHSVGDGKWTKIYTLSSSIWSFATIWGDPANPQHVFAIGPSTIFHTPDGGSTWNNETTAQTPLLRASAGNSYTDVLAVGTQVWSNDPNWQQVTQSVSGLQFGAVTAWGGSYFSSDLNNGDLYMGIAGNFYMKLYSPGFVVQGIYGFGSGTNGQFFFVGLGGHIGYGQLSPMQWGSPAQTSNTTNDLYSVSQAGTGYYAVGANGTILYSTGNGTWAPQISSTTALLQGLWASGANDVYAVGNDSSGNGIVLHLK
jgi:hypothetical protein